MVGAMCFGAFSAFWTTLVFFLAQPPYHYGSDVSLIVENGQIDLIARALEQMVEVRFGAITTGHYDIIADVFFGNYSEVTAFFEKMKRIPGIIQHDSHFILRLLKAEYKYTLS